MTLIFFLRKFATGIITTNAIYSRERKKYLNSIFKKYKKKTLFENFDIKRK